MKASHLLITAIALAALLHSCDVLDLRRKDPEGTVSQVSKGTGGFAFRMAVDARAETLTIELTKKESEGRYTIVYDIDGDASLQLKDTPSGSAIDFPGFDTDAEFTLPGLAEGDHEISVTLRKGEDAQTCSLAFEVASEEQSGKRVPCDNLVVGVSSSIYEGSTLEFVVAVSPDGCTDKVTYTVSDKSVIRIEYDAEWNQWFIEGLKPGKAEVIFACGEKKVRKSITVLKKEK